MHPQTFLRVEGLVVLAISLGSYLALDGPLWLLLLVAVAPDISMLGYLAGPRIGSLTYNVVHAYVLPLTVGSYAVWAEGHVALLVSLIWAGHIGADRLFGYGLKFESGFKETHLSTQPIPSGARASSES